MFVFFTRDSPIYEIVGVLFILVRFCYLKKNSKGNVAPWDVLMMLNFQGEDFLSIINTKFLKINFQTLSQLLKRKKITQR